MRRLMVRGLCLALMVAGMIGCGGGGDDGPSGNSTVLGSVSSVSGGGVTYRPTAPQGWQGFLARIGNVLLPQAFAAVEGVTIRVAGTDLVATTADDGSFIISGVPGGEQTLIFSYGGTTSELKINVPANATVKLEDIDVSSGSVDVGQIEVEIEPEDDSSNANNNGDDDNGNDDNDNDGNDNDDNGNDDNDNDDDNGNDNDDDNENENENENDNS